MLPIKAKRSPNRFIYVLPHNTKRESNTLTIDSLLGQETRTAAQIYVSNHMENVTQISEYRFAVYHACLRFYSTAHNLPNKDFSQKSSEKLSHFKCKHMAKRNSDTGIRFHKATADDEITSFNIL